MAKWLIFTFCLLMIGSISLYLFLYSPITEDELVTTTPDPLVLQASHLREQDWSKAILFVRPKDHGNGSDEFVTWLGSNQVVRVEDLVKALWVGDRQISEHDNFSLVLSPDYTKLIVMLGQYDAYNQDRGLWMYDLTTGQEMYIPNLPGGGMIVWDKDKYVASMSIQGEGYVLADLLSGEIQEFTFERPVSEFHLYEYNDEDGYIYGDGGYCQSTNGDCPSSLMRLAVGAHNPEFVELLPDPSKRRSQRLLNRGIVFSRDMIFNVQGLNVIEDNVMQLKSYSSVYGRVTYVEPMAFSPSGDQMLVKVVIKPDNLPFEGDLTSCFILDTESKDKVYDLTILFEDMLAPYSTIIDCLWIDESVVAVRFGPHANQYPLEYSLWKINLADQTKGFILENVGRARHLSQMPNEGYVY